MRGNGDHIQTQEGNVYLHQASGLLRGKTYCLQTLHDSELELMSTLTTYAKKRKTTKRTHKQNKKNNGVSWIHGVLIMDDKR